MNKTLKRIFIIILLLIIIAILLIISIEKSKKNISNDISNESVASNIDNEIEQTRIENLAGKVEASRIKDYVGQFYTWIETKEYQKSYESLFESFKENYFESEDKFEEYAKSKYQKKIVLNYTKVDREGKYYIVTVEVIDALNIQNKFSQRVVIEEIELNNFNISFQVI